MALIHALVPTKWSWIILAFFIVAIIPADAFRLRRAKLNRLALRIFGSVMREHEATSLSGLSHLLLGTSLILLIFPHHIVTLTLLLLAFGDPFASFIGIRYGKDRLLGNKTLQGSMGALFICTLVSGIYYYLNNLMLERLLIVAPLSGLIGAVAELTPVGHLDDNFTFPILTASGLWLLFHLFGGLSL